MIRIVRCPLLLLTFCTVQQVFAQEVAITIDDLPRGGDAKLSPQADRSMTTKLLAPFKGARIPLIGFVNECRHADELEPLLRLWVEAGADLGNHTCSHMDLNTASASQFEADILKGEHVTARVLGHRPLYFRYPYLHEGKDAEKKAAVQSFLAEHGYRNAPVTLDNSDYMFAVVYANALLADDFTKADRVQKAYLAYMESIIDFFEQRGVEVTGHKIRQILLLHASQLNADTMPDLLAMMRGRGYRFISLAEALEDPAYSLPETYVGSGGFSSIHRWSKTKGMAPKGEPDEPLWIRKEAGF